MGEETKRPIIVIADDDVARNPNTQGKVIEAFSAIAEVLGYNPAHIQKSIKFFDQYASEKGAEHYIQNHDSREVIALAFIDDCFNTEPDRKQKGYASFHGDDLIRIIKQEAQKRGELAPAMVWIASGDHKPLEGLMRGSKDAVNGIKENTMIRRWSKDDYTRFASLPADAPINHEEKYIVELVRALKPVFQKINEFEEPQKNDALKMARLDGQTAPRNPADASPGPGELGKV